MHIANKSKPLPPTMTSAFQNKEKTSISDPNINMTHEKIKGVLLLLSASMGIGCLGIPSSIAQVGLIPWVVIILSVALFYYLSYYVIMKLCVHFEAFTVTQLGSRILNGNSVFIDILYIIVNIAGYLACLITLNEDFQIIAGWLPAGFFSEFLQSTNYFWIYFFTVVTMLILIYIPAEKLHSITFISVLSSTCLILFISFGLLYRSDPIDFDKATKNKNWGKKYHIFMFLGFAFICQQNLMTLRQASNIREFSDIISTVKIFTFCTLLIYFLIGILGYFTFYDDPRLGHSNVLALYAERDLFYGITMILVNLNIQVGNACMLFPIRDILMEYIYGPKPQYLEKKIKLSEDLEANKQQISIFFRNNKISSSKFEKLNFEELDKTADFVECKKIISILYY